MAVSSESGQRQIRDRLERAWLYQLELEHEYICRQYGVPLPLPVFRLSDSRTRLGSWHQDLSQLTLSRYLIRHSPWHRVVQVLKHEMAHQLCMAAIRPGYTGHGGPFLRAGAMLGLEPSWCRSRADQGPVARVSQDRPDPATGAGRALLAKVEKLLALAGSDNEHEAALAMRKAGELLARHNLDPGELGRDGYTRLVIDTGYQRLPRHLASIGSLLHEHFFVRVILGHSYDAMRDRPTRTLELFGRPENVAVAEHCYHFLRERLETLWQAARGRYRGQGARARPSYLLGVVNGFREKLARQTRPQATGPDPDSRYPQPVRDPDLDRFLARYHPRIRSGGRQRVTVHADAYQEALAAGADLDLHRSVDRGDGMTGLLDHS